MQEKARNGRLDGSGGLSASTLHTISLIMRSSLEYAAKERYIPPMEITLKCPENKRESANALSTKDQDALEQSLRHEMDLGKLGILLCLYTGLRIGEICALRWGDVDLSNRLIHISQTVQRLQANASLAKGKTMICIGSPKSKSSLRSIPIPSCLMDLLRDFSSQSNAYFLTGQPERLMEPRAYQYRFKRYIGPPEQPTTTHACPKSKRNSAQRQPAAFMAKIAMAASVCEVSSR